MNSAPLIFNPQQIKNNIRRSEKKFSAHNFLHEFAIQELTDRLSYIQKDFQEILEIGLRPNTRVMQQAKFCLLPQDENLCLTPQSCDLILSTLTLHHTNDLPGVLVQIRNALKPDGLFLACLFGGETLYQLRDCLQRAEFEIYGTMTPRIHPFADKQDIGALLQRTNYALPVIDSEFVTVTYASLWALMRDLQGMGECNTLIQRSKKMTGRGLFDRAEALYRTHYSDTDQRLEARFEIIFLSGWAPHDSQQKPLKPGSAQHRLADALNTKETNLS